MLGRLSSYFLILCIIIASCTTTKKAGSEALTITYAAGMRIIETVDDSLYIAPQNIPGSINPYHSSTKPESYTRLTAGQIIRHRVRTLDIEAKDTTQVQAVEEKVSERHRSKKLATPMHKGNFLVPYCIIALLLLPPIWQWARNRFKSEPYS